MHTLWRPTLESAQTKYRSLFDAIVRGIENGELKDGQKLPAIREMAYQLAITPATVVRAYQLGVSQGLLEARIGDGTYVREKESFPSIGAMPELFQSVQVGEAGYNLRSKSIPEIGQTDLVNRIIAKIALEQGFPIGNYADALEISQIKDAAADWLTNGGIAVSGDEILLTNGVTNGNVLASFLASGEKERAVVVLEPACYVGFFDVARFGHAKLVAGEVDTRGITPESIARHKDAKILLTSSIIQTPYSISMDEGRMAEIAQITREKDMVIIDDLVHAPMVPPPWKSLRDFAPERVWSVTGLAKLGYPGLNFGAIIPPKEKLKAARRRIGALNLRTSQIHLPLITALFAHPEFDSLTDKLREDIEQRQIFAREALAGFDLQIARGSPYIWLRLPETWHASDFVTALARKAVSVASSDTFSLTGQAERAVRLTVGGAHGHTDYRAALEIVADVLRNPNTEMVI